MKSNNEGVQILLFIKELLGDFIVEYEDLKHKSKVCQDNIDEINIRLEDINSKTDVNYDYFSPSGKQVNIEREKLSLELKMQNLNIENYDNQIAILLSKIEHLNSVSKFISNMVSDNESHHEMEKNYINDSLGLQLLETQESERTRIARELHDSTVQNLTNLVHKTELCLKLSDIDIIRTKLELQSMIETIRVTINDMRSIIYDLRPMSIDDLGLVVTIERYIKRLQSENDTVKFEFIVKNDEMELKPVINITLFRIIQEACNNILKHSKASHVVIHLEYSQSEILMTIQDNGVGFECYHETESKANNRSFGLSIMKERTYLLSGKINIESGINEGTKIIVSVPM